MEHKIYPFCPVRKICWNVQFRGKNNINCEDSKFIFTVSHVLQKSYTEKLRYLVFVIRFHEPVFGQKKYKFRMRSNAIVTLMSKIHGHSLRLSPRLVDLPCE